MTRFRIDPDRSRVTIDARSSVHPIHSEAGGLEGYVELGVDSGGVDLAEPASAQLSFPVSNLKSGNGLEDREMFRRIEARRFPAITGVLTEIRADGRPGRYQVSGDVTFRGLTCRCQDFMDIELTGAGQAIRLTGESTFDISGTSAWTPPGSSYCGSSRG